MSVKAIQRMWLATCDDIADVRLRERVQQQLEPETKPLRAHRTFAALFARYVRIVNRLGDLYDQTLQVQKRTVVRRVLESATQRLVELQTELKAIEMSEFVYIDRTLIEEKYTVEEVQLLVPFYYPMVRPPAAQALIEGRGVRAEPAARRAVNRAAAVEGGAEEGGAGEAGDGAEEEEEEQAAEVVPKTMIQMLLEEQRRLAELEANRVDPWADAIRLLQVHEKARQARCQFTYIRLHPDRYRPKPPVVVERQYTFYHKPDTPMSVPVRRTAYESDCYKKLRTYSHVEFYVNPQRLVTGSNVPIAAGSDDEEEVEAIVVQPAPAAVVEAEVEETTVAEDPIEGDGEEAAAAEITVETDAVEEPPPAADIVDVVDVVDVVPVVEAAAVVVDADAAETAVVVAADEQQILSATSVAASDTVRFRLVHNPKRAPSIAVESIDEEAQRLAAEQRRAERSAAASRIQRCFLRWRNRRHARLTQFQRKVDRHQVTSRRWDFASRQNELLGRRRVSERKAAFDEAFRRACEDTRARIVLLRTQWLAEDISDHVRAWFREMWLAGVEREFDAFPPAAKGGTILVLRGETPSPAEFYALMERRDKMALMSAEQKKKMLADEKKKVTDAKKAAKKELLKKKLALKERKAAQAAGDKCWYFDDETFRTKNFVALDQQMIDFERDWRFIDEAGNHQQAPYMEWVEETEYAQVHIELRQVIDALMRVEYELLQAARCKDEGTKYRPPKPPREKRAKQGKKGKKGKAGAYDETAPFGERNAQQVYDDMVADGVIRAHPTRRRVDDFIGDRNYAAFERRNIDGADPLHGHGEVRDVVRHHILGMGDVPFKHPKSMCLVGPPGCGKKFMVDALATEIGVVKFDLSAPVCVRFADDMAAFVQDVVRMARLLQPSMLFVDGAHKPFIKKIAPGGEAEQPRLLGPFVPKILKALKPADRVMLLGTTNEPWNCAVARMKKCWERVLLCPGADYGTTLLTWQTALQRLLDNGPLRLMDVSALSMVTKQYGMEQMLSAAERVVDLKRRVHLERSQLTVTELLEDLLTGEPPNLPMIETDMAKYLKFFTQTNKLAKLRAKAIQAKLAAEAAKKKKK